MWRRSTSVVRIARARSAARVLAPNISFRIAFSFTHEPAPHILQRRPSARDLRSLAAAGPRPRPAGVSTGHRARDRVAARTRPWMRAARASASSSVIQPPMLESATISAPVVTRSTIASASSRHAPMVPVGEATTRRTMTAIVEAGAGASARAAMRFQRQRLGPACRRCSRRRTAAPARRPAGAGRPADRRREGTQGAARSTGQSGLRDPSFMVAPKQKAANASREAPVQDVWSPFLVAHA